MSDNMTLNAEGLSFAQQTDGGLCLLAAMSSCSHSVAATRGVMRRRREGGGGGRGRNNNKVAQHNSKSQKAKANLV